MASIHKQAQTYINRYDEVNELFCLYRQNIRDYKMIQGVNDNTAFFVKILGQIVAGEIRETLYYMLSTADLQLRQTLMGSCNTNAQLITYFAIQDQNLLPCNIHQVPVEFREKVGRM